MTMRGWAAVAALVAAAHAGTAAADQVTSKGTVLKGTVTAVSSSGLTFEPDYGKGAITIAWEDVEDVRTDGALQVLYGADGDLDAPLQGYRDGALLVGADAAGATAVETATIVSGQPVGPGGPGWQDRMRSAWRFWDGQFDLGFSLQQATTDTTGFSVGFLTTRKHAPTTWTLGANYRYGTQQQSGQRRTTIEDRAYGMIRFDYDLTPRFYTFASGDVTYDAIQKLSIRGVPKAGAGYKFWEEKIDADKSNFLSGEVGPGWVYEKYFSGSGRRVDNDYFTVAFGAAAGYWLPYDAHIGWRMDYLPAVDDWANNYLLRNAIDFTVPIVGPIGAKLSFLDEYNSQPAGDAERNALYLTIGLTVSW